MAIVNEDFGPAVRHDTESGSVLSIWLEGPWVESAARNPDRVVTWLKRVVATFVSAGTFGIERLIEKVDCPESVASTVVD
jgi:hypothetical protein